MLAQAVMLVVFVCRETITYSSFANGADLPKSLIW